MATDHIVVLSTVPSVEKAAEIGRALVEAGLAACVIVVPEVRSIYRWQGAICDEPEVLCIIKTRRERIEELRAALVARHPYEVPEVIALDIAEGHPAYLAWLYSSTERTPPG